MKTKVLFRYISSSLFSISCWLFFLQFGVFMPEMNAQVYDQRLIDSLQQVVKHMEPSKERVQTELLLVEAISTHSYNDASDLSSRVLKEALTLNDELGAAKARLYLIYPNFERNNYNQTMRELDSIRIVFEHHDAEAELAEVYNLIGTIYTKQGRFNQAISYYKQSLALFEKYNKIEGKADVVNNIALVYQGQRKYSQALYYFRRSISISNQVKDIHIRQEIQANALNNMAVIFGKQNKYDYALSAFKQVYAFDKQSGDSFNISLSLGNLGYCYLKLGKIQLAKDYLFQSYDIYKNKSFSTEFSKTYYKIGELYLATNQLDSAQYFLEKSMKHGVELHLWPQLETTYALMAKLKEKQKDFKGALTYTRLADEIEDSMFRVENSSNLKFLETDYEALSKNLQEVEEKASLEREASRAIIIWGVVAIAVLSISLMYIYMNKVKKANSQLKVKQKKIEIQNKILQVKNVEIMQAKESAEEAAKLKSQFISTISHEIRTPLNAIIGATNLLNQNTPREDQFENLNILSISSENLLSLVNNILDFSKMEAGKMQFENIEFNLKSIVFDIRDLFSIKAQEKGVELLVTYDDKIPSVLKGDPLRINQLLINLVNNALKFTDHGYVKVDISLQLLTVNHALVHCKVTDTGIGISSQKQSQIFDSFTQADSNTTRKYGGTGLGLSICRRILENLNSKLNLVSEFGKGSSFFFSINFEVSRNAAIGKSSRTASFEDSIQGKRILIAEDNMMNVLVIRQFLQKWGVVTEVAMNGKEAFQRVSDEVFDAVLMDIHMPEMDGIEATRLIRQLPDERKRRIPIIAITAENEMQFRQKVYEVGMNDYIFKPFNPDDLRERLGYVLYNSNLFVKNNKG